MPYDIYICHFYGKLDPVTPPNWRWPKKALLQQGATWPTYCRMAPEANSNFFRVAPSFPGRGHNPSYKTRVPFVGMENSMENHPLYKSRFIDG